MNLLKNRRGALLAGTLAVLAGGVVLIGWALDIAAMKSVLPGWVTMKPNTAVAFVLIGIASLLASRERVEAGDQRSAVRAQPSVDLAGRLAGLLAGLIGLLSLAEYTFDWNPGFDHWLFAEPAGAVGTSHPGRMAPDTAICFALLAMGLEIARASRVTTGSVFTAVTIGALVTTIGLVEILSYFAPLLRTHGWGGLTMMALPTAILFTALGMALIGIPLSRKTTAPDGSVQPFGPSDVATSLRFFLIFTGLAVGILGTGLFYYRTIERRFRIDAEQQLAVIADLKVGELVQWRSERLGDGSILHNNPVFTQLVRRFLASPADADASRALQAWFGKFQAHYMYDRVSLVDVQGTERLPTLATSEPVCSHVSANLATILKSGRVTLLDFHREAPGRPIHLSVSVPILDEADGHRPLGVVVLRIDPARYLYPLIGRWTAPSETAETLLIRREGQEAVFLNSLRFQTNAALTLRVSLANASMPAVQAALGREGIMEGRDYRGVPVFAALRTIPDSPWFLVARRDVAEVFAPLRPQLWHIIIVVGGLLFGAGAGVGFVWRQQRVRFYHARLQAAEALRENELKYRTLFEVTIDAHLLFADGRWVDCNAAAERVFGCPREQIIGAHPRRFSPPLQPDGRSSEEEARKRITLAYESEPQAFEWEHCRADGTPFAAEVFLNRIELGGKPLIQAIVRDISERKQAEAALQTEKQNLDALFESSPVALLLLDETTNIVRVNDAAVALTGGSEAEFLQHRPGNALRCVHSTKDPRGCGYAPQCSLCPARNGIEALIKSGGSMHGAELALELMRNGTPQQVWMHLGAEAVVISGVRHLLVAMEDITKRKQAAMLNTARLHLVEFTATHSLDDLLEETLNEAEKLSGSAIGFYHFVEADQVTLTLQNWSTRTKAEFCRADGKGMHYGIDKAGVWVDCVHQRKPVIHNDYAALPHRKGMPKGHAVVIRELVVPVMQGGQVMAILGVGNKPGDYTSADVDIVSQLADLAWQIAVRKQAEEKVHRLNAELEQRVRERTAELEAANRELEAFSYSVSHDLRAPLRSIDGFSRIVLEDYAAKLDEEGRDSLNRIRAAARRMAQLIDDMLNLSRVSRAELHREELDLSALVREVAGELRQQQPGHAVELVVADGLAAAGDPHLMRIVLENLLGNAWKFTGRCAAPRIEFGAVPDSHPSTPSPQPVFFIRDNGAGFDAAYAGKLFSPFQRLHNNTQFAGTGIGLATVQRIIHRHGGRVWAEGKVDAGAIFFFTLADSADKGASRAAAENPKPTRIPSSLKPSPVAPAHG